MYDREEMDCEVKAVQPGIVPCMVDSRKFMLAVMEAEKAMRRFGESVRELQKRRYRPKPPRFYNPLGVDDARWRSMSRAERRKYIKENK
jgi:hypothetical protein